MPADIELASTSTQYVQIPVSAVQDGDIYNPTGDLVQMAFITSGQPQSGDWHNGSWTTNLQGFFLAQCLVGPLNGGVVLSPQMYTIWVKVTDDPEVPVMPAGTLTIT